MLVTGILLRWYRSFNVRSIGPNDVTPAEPWNVFRGQSFPFVHVPLDRLITTIVGANESGKSHLLSAISKVVKNTARLAGAYDNYEIKDICRYCGVGGLDDSVWPEIGIELRLNGTEAARFQPSQAEGDTLVEATDPQSQVALTVVLNGSDRDRYATVYRDNVVVRTFDAQGWATFASDNLPVVEVLNADLALPNEVHIDELIDLYERHDPKPVMDPLRVQDLWRAVEPVVVVQGGVDAAATARVHEIKSAMEKAVRRPVASEGELVLKLFAGILGVTLSNLRNIRKYSGSERGYVTSLNDEINARIERELDISRYWDQDEDFRLSVNYKAGAFHFQITDRTGSTYTFNERSSGLRYFLSYYIQAKALEKKRQDQGAVILMDEPDSFLSASGQRSLLRVFDALVSSKMAHGPCQLVYTTHSPFLIDRNFPGRIRLVRKGDGNEGTQYVERAAVRRFEPVRSALSIDSADTLFLGSKNVVLEGQSDQKLITACIQRFGETGGLEQLLDLNTVTLVSADGAPYAPELVQKAMRGDEKPPIVVVLLDGDAAGVEFVQAVASIIGEKQACTLREVECAGVVFQVLEDIIPVGLIDLAIHAYADRLGYKCAATYDGATTGANQAKKIAAFCKANVPSFADYEDIEIRSGVVDSLVSMLGDESFQHSALSVLQAHVEAVCRRVNEMIEHAERTAGRNSLKKLVRQHVEMFTKRFPVGASKGDTRKLLMDLSHVATGRSEDAERTRKNVDLLLERLDTEVKLNSHPIVISDWHHRLRRLKAEPWASVRDWSSISASVKTD
jgi:energy-coupling factor transporter ATP-binding protein EcfA2